LRDTGVFTQIANGDLARTAGETDPILFAYRYLIGPPLHCADGLGEQALHADLKQRLDELASGLAMLDKTRLAADPTACYRDLLLSLAPRQGPLRQRGVWFSPDRRHALLVAVTSASASDLASQGLAVRTIEKAFATLPEGDGLTLELAGPGYFAVGSEQRIKSETVLLSTAASVLVALILAWAFRSAQLMLLGMLPLASGILVGTALVALIFGSVHGITLGLGATLLGVALDYPVHVYSHVPGRSADHHRGIWRTLMLGMVTTVLAYAALAWTSFEGLSQLGLLAAAGLATAALTSRYLLSFMLPPDYRLPERRWLSTFPARLPHLSLRAGTWLLGIMIAAVAATLLVRGSPWETDIRRLSTVPEGEILKDQRIRSQLGAPDVVRLLYLIADDDSEVLERLEAAAPHLEALEDRGLIAGFESAARWLPSPRTQRARQAALPDRATLGQTLSAANSGLPFRVERLRPFLDDVDGSRGLSPLRAADLAGTLIETRIGMLLTPIDGRWLGLVPLSGVSDETAQEALGELARRHGMAYLDLRQGAAELLSGFFSETLDRLLIAAAVIFLALALALRNSERLVRVLLPIGIALASTFLVVIILHGAANLFHLVSLLLVAGLAIDYGLFLSRPTTEVAERAQTLFSVSIGAGSSLAMFAMLSLSDIPALRAIGFTVAVGIFFAFLASLLLARAESDYLE
jgi:predicted exporter